jgi:protein-S-isoprenylcysteine O-methyltransferase Ste14
MKFMSFLSPKTTVNLLNSDEVESNRRGEITPAQNDRLNAMALGRQGCGTFIALLAVLAFFFFFLFSSLLDSEGMNWIFLFPLVILLIVLLGFSKGVYNWWRNSTKLKADRSNGLVRSGVGELDYSPKSGFTAKVVDEELILSSSNEASGLLPGVRYNFYYLPESRFVLSAEQLGQVSAGQVRLALTDILARANGFTTEDLQANQNGEVTQAQRMGGLKKLVPGLFIMVVTLVVGILILYPFFSSSQLNSNLLPIIFIGGFLAIFGAIGFSIVLNAFLDLNATAPESVEGEGHKITRRKSSGRSSRTVYYYVIGDREFEVSQKVFPALLEGFTYRAYFMPHTKRLLAIEPTSIPESVGV